MWHKTLSNSSRDLKHDPRGAFRRNCQFYVPVRKLRDVHKRAEIQTCDSLEFASSCSDANVEVPCRSMFSPLCKETLKREKLPPPATIEFGVDSTVRGTWERVPYMLSKSLWAICNIATSDADEFPIAIAVETLHGAWNARHKKQVTYQTSKITYHYK